MNERITAAAIRFNGVVLSLPPPARHHHCIRAATHVGYDDWRPEHEQGFETDTGRFVDRREAMLIARAQGQLIPRAGGYMQGEISNGDVLFSEDVW